MKHSLFRFILSAAISMLIGNAVAVPPSHAPSLSVHETAFGTVTKGDHQESIQELSVRIVSHADPGASYEVQCFFVKQGKQEAGPAIDDTVTFHVSNPHGTYKIRAQAIRLKGSPKPTKATKSQKQASKPTTVSIRAGYIVRVLFNGEILREDFSDHSMRNFVRENPKALDAALSKKTARHLDASELLSH